MNQHTVFTIDSTRQILERFFHELYDASCKYNRIGSYWERGNKNEIDLVAINDINKEIVVAEIKTNKSRINLTELEKKAKNICADYQDYKLNIQALGIEDVALSIVPWLHSCLLYSRCSERSTLAQ
jgi:hypothetical protein